MLQGVAARLGLRAPTDPAAGVACMHGNTRGKCRHAAWVGIVSLLPSGGEASLIVKLAGCKHLLHPPALLHPMLGCC